MLIKTSSRPLKYVPDHQQLLQLHTVDSELDREHGIKQLIIRKH